MVPSQGFGPKGGGRSCASLCLATAVIVFRSVGFRLWAELLALAPGAKQTLQRAAAAAQRSVTDFVLESALSSAAETLADRQNFQLDPERWEAFVSALDAPPQMHPRLARLLQSQPLVALGEPVSNRTTPGQPFPGEL